MRSAAGSARAGNKGVRNSKAAAKRSKGGRNCCRGRGRRPVRGRWSIKEVAQRARARCSSLPESTGRAVAP
eukprot:11174781-Lingulodinium_polyedra.AAC.1